MKVERVILLFIVDLKLSCLIYVFQVIALKFKFEIMNIACCKVDLQNILDNFKVPVCSLPYLYFCCILYQLKLCIICIVNS